MSEPTPTAAVANAAYYFFKFQIEIDTHDKDLFNDGDKKRGLDANSPYFSIVWHEYVHYLQNVTTTIGIRIFLNWVKVLTRFSVAVANRNPLPVPMYMDRTNPFSTELNELMAEMSRLMGSTTPLDLAPPADAEPFAPYIDPKDDAHALLCIEESGQRIGIPLAGNAFIEGMTQGVQWLIEGDGAWDGSLLKGRKIGGNTAYYDAIIRYFAHHAPGVNPCIPAIVVSHAALQTTQPAEFFCVAHHQGMPQAARKGATAEFAKALRTHPRVKEGISTALADLTKVQEGNKDKAGTDFYDMIVEMADLMRQALIAYDTDHGSFIELTTPTASGLESLAERYYFPPLYTKDIDAGWSLKLPPTQRRLYALMAAMCSLAFDVNGTNLADVECPLLRKRYCTFPKKEKEYCHRNRLNFEEIEGEVCSMGRAAQLMNLYRRSLKRLI